MKVKKINQNKINFQKLLKENNFRITEGRINLLNIFYKNKKPLSVKMILEILKKNKFAFDKASLYRCVEDFSKKDILRKVYLGDEIIYYEFINKDQSDDHNHDEHHHHIVCKSCGQIEDVEMCFKKDFEKQILEKSKSFKNISYHSLEFFGNCKKCE